MRALIVDWGGVLTNALREPFERWAEDEGVDHDHYLSVLKDLLGQNTYDALNPIHALERGEVSNPDFEKMLGAKLKRVDGKPLDSVGMLERMFSYIEHAPNMNALVRRAREKGITTALLSNSWGNTYPRDLWDGMFDHVVISGEVGMRKPEAEIFQYTLGLLQVEPSEAVFVDDLVKNIEGARAVGLVAVHHREYESTLFELEALFGCSLT
jgi:putative hydrolase of the HAD superfamily/hydrolase